MHRSRRFKTAAAAIALMSMTQPLAAMAATSAPLTIAPASGHTVRQFTRPATSVAFLSHAQKLALLQAKVKYVFVLFQENRSFDHYFGTYPGANGLFSQPASATPGFVQPIVNTDGTVGTISPFLIPQSIQASGGATVQLYPADTDSSDHSHAGIDNGLDVVNGVALNDRYALNAEGFTTSGGAIVTKSGVPLSQATPPSLSQKQKAELDLSHIDCDTVPVLWNYADRFTLFDNFNQTIIGPSTPNAIAMIAGQSGETQWVLHPGQGSNNTGAPGVATSGGEPIVSDPGPFAGSNLDTSAIKPPYGPDDVSPATPAFNQTYASLPLSFMGKTINKTIISDQNPALYLVDVQGDISTIADQNVVNWGWYQEGYDHEPTDGTGPATNANYITHHNGPQYFGYVGDNPAVTTHLHGLADFYNAVSAATLRPGVFYVRGGYGNNDGLTPLDQDTAVQANFPGNDDHPGYSDAQISGALLADEVNAIVNSPYWKDSAIIITYDETDGLYDHQSPAIRATDPEGNPLSGGPRIPAIVLSPYGVVHGVSHVRSEHSSVIKFIDELFKLTPLADLPVERAARAEGEAKYGQAHLGPADDFVPDVGDLFEAFDDGRLTGKAPPLPAQYAFIPSSLTLSLPQYGGRGCYALNIVPTDYVNGQVIDPAPADFNPRPSTNPGEPSLGNWPSN